MKNYIVLDSQGKPQVICPRGFIPSEVICEAPQGYDPNQDDGRCLVLKTKKGKPVVTVNVELRDKIRAERLQALKAREDARPMAQLRDERNRRLSECDWTQLTDAKASMSAGDKVKWKNYRKALRDLTKGLEDPSSVTWPKPPRKED